jgi:hypothetical protein
MQGAHLATFHGDGATLKTYRNLTVNASAVQVVLDPEQQRGYALFGACEEVSPETYPEVWREVRRGFEEIGFGVPGRLFRHLANRAEPIAVAPATC